MSASASTLATLMEPKDANPMGNVHGGAIMKLVDQAAAAAAIRHSGRICVTVAVDRLDFFELDLRALGRVVDQWTLELFTRRIRRTGLIGREGLDVIPVQERTHFPPLSAVVHLHGFLPVKLDLET